MTEIQSVFGLNFFQISDLTFVASEFKTLDNVASVKSIQPYFD